MQMRLRSIGRYFGVSSLLLTGLFSGCGRDEIKVYSVPKEKDKVVAHTALPQGWTELPADQMRVGNYSVAGKNGKAQVSIIPLPGTSGGELENFNRWRGQVGLSPLGADALAKEAVEVQVAGAPARLFEMSGVSPQTKVNTRILAAMQNHGESMWFFKMMGDDELVREQKPAFVAFLAGYQFPGASSAEATIPPGHPPIESLTTQSEASGKNWNAPAGWKEQQPGPMQDAKFSIANDKATVTVSILEGSAGGLLANVNRWRGQIELPAIDEAKLASTVETVDLPDGKAKLVDMTGPNQRMVAAVVPRGSSTWFFKLKGESATVEAEKKAFVTFIQTAK